MTNPIEWAKKAVDRLGWVTAYGICIGTGRKLIGEKNDIPNPHHYFYKMAGSWILKNKPPELHLKKSDS